MITSEENEQIQQAAQVILRGGVIAYPTESVYGLGCDPTNLAAIKKILSIKNRSKSKGLIILVSKIEQALPYLLPLSSTQLAQLATPKTRATTWLIPCKKEISALLSGNSTKLAIRITQHPIAQAICNSANSALVSTSCNLSGQVELSSAIEVEQQMGSKLDFIVDGKVGGQAPSQIIDLISGQIIRN